MKKILDGSPEVGDVDRSSSQATKTAFQCLGCEYLTNDINQLREHRHTEHGVAINDEGTLFSYLEVFTTLFFKSLLCCYDTNAYKIK